jgi:hypothetical protein
MNVAYKIGVVLLIGLCLSGCKPDDDSMEEPSIVGIYTMHVKVTKRPPIIRYDNGRPANIPFDHQILYDEVMDTSQNICCPSKFGTQHDCPMEYSIENVKIFEDDKQLYLQNNVDTIPTGEQVTFHVPLFESEQNLVFEKLKHPTIGYYRRDKSMISTGGSWPSAFDLLYFSVENKSSGILKGAWVLRDLMDQDCLGLAEMSDGKIHPCRMGEFAEFTLVKNE